MAKRSNSRLAKWCGAASVTAMATAMLSIPVDANRNFVPDWTFKGSALTGTRTIGQATWRAENGEIVGTPTNPAGGWLLLSEQYQDVQFAAEYSCATGCKAGVMVRSESTGAGLKGAFVSLANGTDPVGAFALTLDGSGQEVGREALRPAAGMVRSVGTVGPTRGGGGGAAPATGPAPAGRGAPGAAGPGAGRAGGRGEGGGNAGPGAAVAGEPGGVGQAAAAPAAGRGGAGGRGGRAGGGGAVVSLTPYTPRNDAFRPEGWNSAEVIADSNILRVFVNDLSGATGQIDDPVGRYGPVAFYVGGTAPVRFRQIESKDLGRRVLATEKVSSRFRLQRISDAWYAWSATSADFNRDGVLDVAAGPLYFLGPDFQVRREFFVAQTANITDGRTPFYINHAADFTGDGWPDYVVTEFRGLVMYVNPKGERRRWDRFPAVPTNSGEQVDFDDIDGDGKVDVAFVQGATVNWASPDPANPTAVWPVHTVSPPGFPSNSGHGLGIGDVNGDKRMDIVHAHGWLEQPAGGAKQTPWQYHPVAFGRLPRGNGAPGGAEIGVYDVNGDGLNDVVTALEAHGWGLAWYEQKRDAAGARTFVQHVIMDNLATTATNAGGVAFSQLHASTFADIDGDRIQDVITGKRWLAHGEGYYDPDGMATPVVYWYRTVRDPKAPGGARFVPDLLHNRSGVGSSIGTGDLNKDGAVDVFTSDALGTHIFWNTPRPGGAR